MTDAPADLLLRFEGVGMLFPSGLLALQDIDLPIRRGAFVALLGPSGSGKSTLLRLAAKLTRPSQGHVHWAREDLRVSVVFQEPTLMPWARILDNVALPLRLAGSNREAARGRAKDMLDKVGLSDFTKAYPAELSGGMKMRASLARALITDPHLLLLDEPFGALDEITRARLAADLQTLWQARRPSILFITHSVFEAVMLAEEIYVLSARPGRVTARFEIDAAYPRADAFRLGADFAAQARAVSQALALGSEGRESHVA